MNNYWGPNHVIVTTQLNCTTVVEVACNEPVVLDKLYGPTVFDELRITARMSGGEGGGPCWMVERYQLFEDSDGNSHCEWVVESIIPAFKEPIRRRPPRGPGGPPSRIKRPKRTLCKYRTGSCDGHGFRSWELRSCRACGDTICTRCVRGAGRRLCTDCFDFQDRIRDEYGDVAFRAAVWGQKARLREGLYQPPPPWETQAQFAERLWLEYAMQEGLAL